MSDSFWLVYSIFRKQKVCQVNLNFRFTQFLFWTIQDEVTLISLIQTANCSWYTCTSMPIWPHYHTRTMGTLSKWAGKVSTITRMITKKCTYTDLSLSVFVANWCSCPPTTVMTMPIRLSKLSHHVQLHLRGGCGCELDEKCNSNNILKLKKIRVYSNISMSILLLIFYR